VHVPDGWSGPRLSALALAVLVRQQAGIEVVLQYASRDKPLLGLQSELLGAYAMGVRHILAVTGEARHAGDYADATAVVDVDSIGLVNAVSRLNQGLDVGGQTIGDPTSFHLGVTVNPAAEDMDGEIRRFEYKVAAGAEYVITRPVFDVRSFERLHQRLEDSGLPIVLGLRPFEDLLDAEYLAHEAAGSRVPAETLDRMRRAGAGGGAEGVAIAAEIGRALRSLVHGVHVSSPAERFDLGLALLDALD
jgi:homocysteine S-methyltransferase